MGSFFERAHRWLYKAAWATLLVALVLIGTAIYWGVYPYEGLKEVTPIVIAPSPVQSGKLATMTISYCVDQSLPLPIHAAREMELQVPNDAQVFTIAPPVSYLIEKRCETRKMTFGIPAFTPPGRYHLHYITSLQVNPVRQVQQSFISEPFIVVEPTKE